MKKANVIWLVLAVGGAVAIDALWSGRDKADAPRAVAPAAPVAATATAQASAQAASATDPPTAALPSPAGPAAVTPPPAPASGPPLFQERDSKGQKIGEGPVDSKQRKHGLWTEWQNGAELRGRYVKGVREGEWVTTKDGSIMTGTFVHGKPEGTFALRNAGGELIGETKFVRGAMTEQFTYGGGGVRHCTFRKGKESCNTTLPQRPAQAASSGEGQDWSSSYSGSVFDECMASGAKSRRVCGCMQGLADKYGFGYRDQVPAWFQNLMAKCW